jgi:hypothetical protein
MSSTRKSKYSAAINDVDHGSVLAFGGSEKSKTSARKKEKAKAKQEQRLDLEAVNEELSKHVISPKDNSNGKENRKCSSASSNGSNAQPTITTHGDRDQPSLGDGTELRADASEGEVGDDSDAVGRK